jgi:hypothetical protein
MNDVLKEISKDVYLNGSKQLKTEDIFDIIQDLRPGCKFDISFSENEILYHHFWHPDNLPAPTLDEVTAEIDYRKECNTYYQYAYDRCLEYPDGFEQFDMLWHAVNDGCNLKNSEWFNTIKAIKEKYPKPDREPPIKKNK